MTEHFSQNGPDQNGETKNILNKEDAIALARDVLQFQNELNQTEELKDKLWQLWLGTVRVHKKLLSMFPELKPETAYIFYCLICDDQGKYGVDAIKALVEGEKAYIQKRRKKNPQFRQVEKMKNMFSALKEKYSEYRRRFKSEIFPIEKMVNTSVREDILRILDNIEETTVESHPLTFLDRADAEEIGFMAKLDANSPIKTFVDQDAPDEEQEDGLEEPTNNIEDEELSDDDLILDDMPLAIGELHETDDGALTLDDVLKEVDEENDRAVQEFIQHRSGDVTKRDLFEIGIEVPSEIQCIMVEDSIIKGLIPTRVQNYPVYYDVDNKIWKYSENGEAVVYREPTLILVDRETETYENDDDSLILEGGDEEEAFRSALEFLDQTDDKNSKKKAR